MTEFIQKKVFWATLNFTLRLAICSFKMNNKWMISSVLTTYRAVLIAQLSNDNLLDNKKFRISNTPKNLNYNIDININKLKQWNAFFWQRKMVGTCMEFSAFRPLAWSLWSKRKIPLLYALCSCRIRIWYVNKIINGNM